MHPFINVSCPRNEDPRQVQFCAHTHARYELYSLISGEVEFFVEGTRYLPKPGDILLIKKAESHALNVKGSAPYHRLVAHFDEAALLSPQDGASILTVLNDRPLGAGNLFSASSFPDNNWQYYLQQMHAGKDLFQKRLYLTVLLQELSTCSAPIQAVAPKDVITEVIAYINANLTGQLNLELLCTKFFFSKAQLNRRFKRVTGTTVWEYIITKRLLLAKSLLQTGEAPTAACFHSGFRDYCTFFRAYKARFGTVPRQDCRRP